tara:strand:- start:19304 stop:20215 length:912 start_codon:yes stop_codon:yes gene_type:complete
MSIFTKGLQNIGSIIRQAGTGGANAVQSRLAQAGLFPGGISGNSRKPLASNAGSPSSTGDWAVKLTLARQTYSDLFGASPLSAGLTGGENGMRFPTTPFINLQHTANYNQIAVMHNNYPYQAYQNSQVAQITISGDFPVQDQASGLRWLSTVHFLRTITKMYYGGELNTGNPPPVARLNGYGDHVFNNVPCVVTDFTVEFRQNVDYIGIVVPTGGSTALPRGVPGFLGENASEFDRARFGASGASQLRSDPTQAVNVDGPINKVPTDSLITVTVIPVYSRNKISNQFDLKSFANGDLTNRGFI